MSEFGEKTERFVLVQWPSLLLAVILLALAVVGIASTHEPVYLYCFGAAVFVMAIMIIRAISQLSLELNAGGFTHTRLVGRRTVRWDELDTVKIDYRTRKPLSGSDFTPFLIASWTIWLSILIIDLTLNRSSSRFDIYLDDGTHMRIVGGTSLEAFQPILEKHLIDAQLTPTLVHLSAGAEIALSPSVFYSSKGIEGTRVRRGARSRREESFLVGWNEIESIDTDKSWLEVRGKQKVLLSVPLHDALNVAVLRAVAGRLRSAGRTA